MNNRTQDLARSSTRVSTLLWPVLGLLLVAYGLFAFDSGTKLTPLLSDAESSGKAVQEIIRQADKGVSMTGRSETDTIPSWINVVARMESSRYAHGSDGVLELEEHYYSMSEKKRHVLSTHMMLGLVLMATGFLQFWPGFRRKQRKAHRITGAVYLLAAFVSMSMSASHLITTPIEDIYSTLVFYYGLWFILVVALASMTAAMFALYKGNIALHLGLQALAFGSFLTAPVQRFFWVSLAPLSDGRSFNEMNIVVNVILFGLCFLGSYWLFFANRQSSPLRRQDTAKLGPKAPSRLKSGVVGLLFLASWIASAVFFVLTPGLAGSDFARRLASPSIIAAHDAVLDSSLPLLVLAAMAGLLFAGWRIILSGHEQLARRNAEAYVAVSAGTLMAGVFIYWGYALGLPTHETSLAGVFYATSGLLILFFVFLLLFAVRSKRPAMLREWTWFAVLLAHSPGILYAALYLIDAIGFITEPYAQQGHGYQIAAAVGLFVPMILAQLIAISSAETRRYAIS